LDAKERELTERQRLVEERRQLSSEVQETKEANSLTSKTGSNREHGYGGAVERSSENKRAHETERKNPLNETELSGFQSYHERKLHDADKQKSRDRPGRDSGISLGSKLDQHIDEYDTL